MSLPEDSSGHEVVSFFYVTFSQHFSVINGFALLKAFGDF